MDRTEPRVGRYLIYGLLDPRDRCLRYVGKTHKRREVRLAEHIASASAGTNAPVYEWIRSLQRECLVPEIFVLERVDASADWKAAECRWMLRCREWTDAELPYTHAPQTPKSSEVVIAAIRLLNIRAGG